MPVISTHNEHTATPPPLVLTQLLFQSWKPRAISVAARLHLAEELAEGPRTVAELAEAAGAHAPSLHRLMRALARIGIFAELDGSRFANSELSHLLRSDIPESLYGMATMVTDLMWPAWGKLLHSVQTGEPTFDKVYGMPIWQYYAEHDPAAGTLANKAMANFSPGTDLVLAQAADLSGVRTVVDVGGGYGGLLTALLATHPSIERGILFDQPYVIDEARITLDHAPGGRIQLAGGDFFTAVPAGADAYVMKFILHDWDDTACRKLLSTCRRAMDPQGRLLAAELVIDPDRSDELAYALDLQMLISFTGKERTAAEFRELYEAAGLRLTRIIPTASIFSLIEGIPQGNGQDES
ncbi:MAG: methyltransferase [Pseudonocardiaceae bacterium]